MKNKLVTASKLVEGLNECIKKFGDLPVILEFKDEDDGWIYLGPIKSINIGQIGDEDEGVIENCLVIANNNDEVNLGHHDDVIIN